MQNPLKIILFVTIGISFLGILMYNISLWTQSRNFEKYDMAFNSKRNMIGLRLVSKNLKSDKMTWDNWNELSDENYDDGKISKFRKILSLKDITTGMIYENNAKDKNSPFKSKIVWLNSNILFWKNGIESEMDVYEKITDSVTTENLSIRYYFQDDNGNENYFEVNHSVDKLDEFYCGTPITVEREEQRISGKPYFGNITKRQADSILTKWNKN